MNTEVADRHKIWRDIANDFRQLEERAPDGFPPVVDVYLVNRNEPVHLNLVQTSRNPSNPWTLLIQNPRQAGKEQTDELSRDDLLVYVREGLIERIETHFERIGKRQVGFSYEERDDSPVARAA